jgi:capsular polysaccharide biosynthesis protein
MSAGLPEGPASSRRIYIDRSNATNRRVPNEAALIDRLRERGFTTVRPEELDLEAQIALFKEAGMVVGQLGAGLANIAFCRPGTVVYEMVPEHHKNPCFLAMALQGDLTYWADVFPTGVAGSDHTSKWSMELDIGHVDRRIEELEGFIPRERHLSLPSPARPLSSRLFGRISRALRAGFRAG